MIKYSNTTVFNVNVQTIVNTVNCVGVMGAGLALECKLRFPEMYQDYVKRCKEKSVIIDRPYLYRYDNNLMIMNFPTKKHWKYPSKIEWLEKGLNYFTTNYKRSDIKSIAFPKLGSGHGRLDWKNVKSLMEYYLEDVDIDVYICLDDEGKASGIERIMVDMLNDTDDERWVSKLSIRKDILDNILNALPIHRFFQLQKVKGVGKQSYEKIFQVFYSYAQQHGNFSSYKNNSESSNVLIQQSLFA